MTRVKGLGTEGGAQVPHVATILYIGAWAMTRKKKEGPKAEEGGIQHKIGPVYSLFGPRGV